MRNTIINAILPSEDIERNRGLMF